MTKILELSICRLWNADYGAHATPGRLSFYLGIYFLFRHSMFGTKNGSLEALVDDLFALTVLGRLDYGIFRSQTFRVLCFQTSVYEICISRLYGMDV